MKGAEWIKTSTSVYLCYFTLLEVSTQREGNKHKCVLVIVNK